MRINSVSRFGRFCSRMPPVFNPLHRTVVQTRYYTSSRNVEEEPTPAWTVGKLMDFPLTENHAFRKYGLPKKVFLEFGMLSKPCSVIRDATLTTLDMLGAASQKSSLETRVVYTGSAGCGKSFLLLQAVDYCVSGDWIVMYIPRAVNLVNSTTTHIYDPRTRSYLQPNVSYETLQHFLTVNASALHHLHTHQDMLLDKDRPISRGTPLTDLINIGLREQNHAPTVLSMLFQELGTQSQYPVLLAVDDFQALYCKTAYRDPHFVPIKPYHLSFPRLLLEYASGRKSFARGAILCAITSSDPYFQTPIELREALSMDNQPPSPYTKVSTVLKDYARGLRSFTVPERLSIDEAASLFEVWMKDRANHSLHDELFLSKYSESSGNPRNFVWKGLLSTLET